MSQPQPGPRRAALEQILRIEAELDYHRANQTLGELSENLQGIRLEYVKKYHSTYSNQDDAMRQLDRDIKLTIELLGPVTYQPPHEKVIQALKDELEQLQKQGTQSLEGFVERVAYERVKEERDTLQNTAAGLKTKVIFMEAELTSLKKLVAKYESSYSIEDELRLEKERDDLKNQVTMLETQVQHYTAELTAMRENRDALQRDVDQLTEEAKEKQEHWERVSSELNARIRELERNLRGL